MEFLAWWNLVFELPILAGIMYALLMATGTVHAEHDADIAIGHDVQFDHDVEVGAQFEHGIEHAHGSEPEHSLVSHQDTGLMVRALSFLGIGKVPLSILLMTYCYTFGFIGWAVNQLIVKVLPAPEIFFWASFGIATMGSLASTRFIAAILAKLLPKTESYGVSRRLLVGRIGQARYDITPTFGEVNVYDEQGNLHQVGAHVEPGKSNIPAGTEVGLLEYRSEEGVFIVATIGQIRDM